MFFVNTCILYKVFTIKIKTNVCEFYFSQHFIVNLIYIPLSIHRQRKC